ncbi:MAG: EamA family transporter RarD [Clostridia bacterium]
MKNRSLWLGLSAYILWGSLTLYWHLLQDVHPVVILCARILFAGVFTIILLCCMGKLHEVWMTFRDWKCMRVLIATGILITTNWGLYIWAVNSGHVLDASLGYYMNPIMSFAFGVLLFHEKCGVLDYTAIGLAAAGVLISTFSFGAFPSIAMTLALQFCVYGVLKKNAHTNALVGITVETLLVAPFALAYLLFSKAGHAEIGMMSWKHALLLIGAGPVTAIPLILFSAGVKELPLSTMGFLQFVSPTLTMMIGVLLLGETFTDDKIVAFCFIFAALLVYTLGIVLRERGRKRVY